MLALGPWTIRLGARYELISRINLNKFFASNTNYWKLKSHLVLLHSKFDAKKFAHGQEMTFIRVLSNSEQMLRRVWCARVCVRPTAATNMLRRPTNDDGWVFSIVESKPQYSVSAYNSIPANTESRDDNTKKKVSNDFVLNRFFFVSFFFLFFCLFNLKWVLLSIYDGT